ncbi:MAG: 3-hydroxyacyl-CoA dehydrogenase family protein [Deltaproteobacteria bacterium]|nr:3-hydroxyacyl-CoA dehydrogenase family protein [Deltaproteobacteria bacterium]
MLAVDEIKNIGIVGAGLMGHCIAQVFALHGYKVRIFDTDRKVLEEVPERIRNNAKVFIDLNLLNESNVEDCLGNITLSENIAALSEGVHLVIEAVSENLDLKIKVFSEIEENAAPDAILCSNTSAISITEISSGLKHRKRFLGTHFWNPPHILPCVEVIKGQYTSEHVFETTVEVMKKIDKEPVRVMKDVPGFLGNRMQHAMWREAISLVENNIASPDDIDKVVKYGFGLRCPFIGPLETADLAGVDLTYAVHKYLLPHLENSPEPSPVLKERLDRGMSGVKAGRGFHTWTPEKIRKIIEQRDLILLKTIQEITSQL